MVQCEEGYRCDICGNEVEAITDSDLYLRYVLGEISPLRLKGERERHIRCHPELAQYIVDPAFEPLLCTSIFAKASLDPEFVQAEEARVTQGWHRLQEIPTLGVPITEYPLAEVRAKWKKGP